MDTTAPAWQERGEQVQNQGVRSMRKNFLKTIKQPASWLPALLILLLPTVVPAQQGTEASRMPMEPAAPESEGVPLTLREALALALDNNLNIAVRRYEPIVSEADILFERGVFEPTLSFAGSQQELTSLSVDPFTQSQPSVVNNIRAGSVTFSDPLSSGGRLTATFRGNMFRSGDPRFAISPVFSSDLILTYDQSLLRDFGFDVNKTGIRIARRNLSISESQFRQAVIDTINNVEKAYWDLKFALQDLEVKRHSMRLSQETMAQNKIRVEVGTMAPIEVTTAEAEVASRHQEVLLAENALENSRDLLLLRLNQPKTSPLWVLPVNPVDEPPFDPEMTIDLEAAIQEAYANRPDLEQTQFLLENDEDIVARARNGLRMDLTARAQYQRSGLTGKNTAQALDTDGDGIPDLFIPARSLLNDSFSDAASQIYDEIFDSWLVSLNLAIPLGNKQAKARFLNARLRQEQRREFLDAQELDTVISVRNSARAVHNTVERVQAARVNVRLQRERLSAENKRYENGMTTTFNLFQFQDDLTQAESMVSLALVDYNKALSDLETAKGTLARSRGVIVQDLMAQGRAVVDLP
ncbi:MAG: TolC family protein [Acidobacteria bacterium]|nr:MAG: TolC family protein [Acidobacteriota bacterium]